MATLAGPQLVVPVMNARYALNAANARWGSLYDALYGTDVIPEDDGAERGGAYNPVRGDRVIAYARDFLDRHCPLSAGSHSEATPTRCRRRTAGRLADGQISACRPGPASRLYRRARRTHRHPAAPQRPAYRNPDRPRQPHRRTDAAGVKDVVLEAALTTIQDCEDSVAAVDARTRPWSIATGWA